MAVTLGQLIKKPNLGNLFKFMGDNPDSAIWVACTIALFKGVFRPIFTMRDKKSDPETKKYTAIREALTELIAIPVYYAVPKFGSKIIIDKFYKNADKVTQKAVGTNVKFLGVLASTAIIPAVCNLIQAPIMDAYKKSQDNKKLAKFDNVTEPIAVNKPSFSGRQVIPPIGPSSRQVIPPIQTSGRGNYGMRVGS